MKISDIVLKKPSEVDLMPRFDLITPPKIGKWYLQPVAWLLSFPEVWKRHAVIRKHNMKGLKGGYLMLCNHNSFFDFKVATAAFFPRRANYIVAVDGFINREAIMRDVGCIAKRKFIRDVSIVRQIKSSVVDHQQICALYPEARYSLVGTTSGMPASLGKLIKLLNSPVVTFIAHGHHLAQPVWNLKPRKVNTSADMTLLLTKDDVAKLSVEEINQRVSEAFVYDDYAYQLENHLKIVEPFRAEGLHKPLYQCASCRVEGHMNSQGSELFCESCGKRWQMDEYGQLKALSGTTEFSHIPTWFEWQRSQVREQIETGSYSLKMQVQVDSLPNATGFYRFGEATISHGPEGFELIGHWGDEKLHILKSVLDNESIHIEYDYFGKGDGFSFSLPNDTYYFFPLDQRFSVTKLHFAVEELYKRAIQER